VALEYGCSGDSIVSVYSIGVSMSGVAVVIDVKDAATEVDDA
jgi:hypothetical protein